MTQGIVVRTNGISINIVVGFESSIVFSRKRRDDSVENTHIVRRCNKVSDKVVAVVCRGFKTDDDAVLVE